MRSPSFVLFLNSAEQLYNLKQEINNTQLSQDFTSPGQCICSTLVRTADKEQVRRKLINHPENNFNQLRYILHASISAA
jgi:hypothetical protein